MLLSRALSGAWRTSPEPLDISEEALGRITSHLLDSGAAGLVWSRARMSNLKHSPHAVALRQAYRFQTLEAALHEQEIADVFARLEDAGIEPILIKGWAIARSYAEKGLRPSGDIDLVVRPAELDAAVSLLKAAPPRKYNVDFRHREFARMDSGSLQTLWDRSQVLPLGQSRVRVLGPEDHLIFLCLHALRHGAWRPLWLCDIAAGLESRPAGFDWNVCLGGSPRQREWVVCAIKLAHRLVAASVDNTPVSSQAARLPQWLVTEVLKQWESPRPIERMALDYSAPMARSLSNPADLIKGIRARWPNPIEATISVGGPLNDLPRLPFQLGSGVTRFGRFLSGLGDSLRGE